MRLLARLSRLYALALACGALYLAPRSYGARLPSAHRHRLWEVWPALHPSMHRCSVCGQARWGEDLAVDRLLWGGSVLVCDSCLEERV